MTVRHTPSCLCTNCRHKVVEPILEANSYRTKTNVFTVVALEFDGRTWYVYYTVHNTYDNKTYHDATNINLWNKRVKKHAT